MEAQRAATVGSGQNIIRGVGKVICAGLVLVGLQVVGAMIDFIPYVGSPQFDYFGVDFDKPFLPQILARALPFLAAGAFVSVLGLANVRGRFSDQSAPLSLIGSWLAWALAILVMRCFGSAFWLWPLDMAEAAQIIRYAAVNAVVSATVLLAAQWLVSRYAGWSARPRTRWAEALLWFAGASVLIVGFNLAMIIAEGLSVERLATDTWQMILLLGGILALAAAATPRAAGSPSPVRAHRRGPELR